MPIAIVTGSGGLIGAEAVRFFSRQNFDVVGIDNDMRKELFGPDASTAWSQAELQATVPGYTHFASDIRRQADMDAIFSRYSSDIRIIVHTAAQPSHDWAAKDPFTDYSINADGTLVMLECLRKHCPQAVFIYTSTNKVYGDTPNRLPLIELDTRWEVEPGHPYAAEGIDESMSVDQTKHSLFGVSKLAADVMVQEYGRYFGLATGCFRGGCLTGSGHSGTMLHGFLSYLAKCAVTGSPYTIFGYKGKQVRDNIHSSDLVNMFWHFYQHPRPGEVYNAGGGRHSNCSMLEAIALCEELTGKKMNVTYCDDARIGDHIWYISDTRKFQRHYPGWSQQYNLRQTLTEICAAMARRV